MQGPRTADVENVSKLKMVDSPLHNCSRKLVTVYRQEVKNLFRKNANGGDRV